MQLNLLLTIVSEILARTLDVLPNPNLMSAGYSSRAHSGSYLDNYHFCESFSAMSQSMGGFTNYCCLELLWLAWDIMAELVNKLIIIDGKHKKSTYI
jgi:hypothetical protein